MNGGRHDEEPHGKIRIAIGLILIFIILCGFFFAGYGLTSLIFRVTGRPPESLAHVLSSLVGMAVFSLIVFLFNWLRKHKGGDGRHYVHTAMMDVLDQIAHGNFEILINMDEIGPQHHDVANAINDMARSLGSVETMRQDFISNVSHEIQSPLTSIGGFAALMQKDDLADDERRRYAAIIEAESKRLSSLSDNLLKLSSLDNHKIPPAMQDFRLDKQLERIALTLEPQWTAKRILLEADLQKLIVCGDEGLLSQVWMNLLHNAIKFTPEGGRIDITLSMDGNSAVVKISDTGDGIGPEDQIHIFERFYKADKARDRSLGGNGLGLSLVKKIVELHGGSVTVDSEAGKGTAFEVFLPLMNPERSS